MSDSKVIETKHLKKQFYDVVFSIGEACYCATTLNKYGLRRFSGPWDWCVGGSFLNRIKMTCNGFEGFIDKEDLKFIGTREEPEPCDIYLNTKNGICFNHDFALGVELDVSYPAVATKYKRRTDRLAHLIGHSKRSLAVYMELPNSNVPTPSDADFDEAARLLNERYAPARVDMLYLCNDLSVPDGKVLYRKVNEHVTLGRLCIHLRGHEDPQALSKKNLKRAISYINTPGKRLAILRRKLFKLPARGTNTHFTLLGIKFKLR